MADWIEEAKEARVRLLIAEENNRKAAVLRFYANAIELLKAGKSQVFIPSQWSEDVARELEADGALVTRGDTQSGSVMLKVDF